MNTPILATKIYIPPRRSELVPRPRLIERLDAGLGRKLTLISAPAGFGKTTLLAEWIAEDTAPQPEIPSPKFCWLSLDKSDNDPARFWRYAIAALQTVDTAIGETAQAALQSPQQPPLETLVTALLNDVATLPISLILILDDYHAIEAQSIHEGVNFLLDNAPPQLHLVITTREDPPLALPRRRGRREIAEIRAAELRFTTEEAAELLNAVLSLSLSPEDVAALEERTEGWIVGLQLAALSLQERDPSGQRDFVAAFAGNDRYVVDYLVEEVLQRQPRHIQSFLLQTSALERLCGPLCDAVTGRDDSQAILEYLEQANLFTLPLDNRRHWYRYHQLFADLLRQRLVQSRDVQDITSLHLKASGWHEQEGLIAEAVPYALAASDFEYAADLIERHVLDVFYRSEIILVHNWLQALPKDVIRSHPLLQAVYANTVVLVSSYSPESAKLAAQWLQEAENTLAAQSHNVGTAPSDQSTLTLAASFLATFRAYLARFRGDDPQTVIDLSFQALNRLPQDDLRFRSALANNIGFAYLTLGDSASAARAFEQARQIGEASGDLFNTYGAIHAQAELSCGRGQLRQAAALCREALLPIQGTREQASRLVPYTGTVYITLGQILLEWNEIEEAEGILRTGIELVNLTTADYVRAVGHVALARLRRAQGDLQGALDVLQRVEPARADIAAFIAAHKARLWLAQPGDTGDLSLAVKWVQERQPQLNDVAPSAGPFNAVSLTLARLLIIQHRRQGQPDLQPLLQFLDKQLHSAQKIA